MKKKITFVVNNFLIGGTEKFLYDLIRSFNKEKFDITIVTVWGSGPMEKDFKALGIPIIFLGSKNLPRFFILKLFWPGVVIFRLTAFFKKTKPDIVITSLYQADVLGIFSAWLTGVKKRIFIQHDVKQLNLFVRTIKEIFAVNLATKIVANSNTTKEFLVYCFKAPEKKIKVIYNGIDVQNIRLAIKNIEKKKEIVFGVVARLDKIKGHIFLLKALIILKERNNLTPAVLIVGDGKLRGELEGFVKRHKLSEVRFTGIVDDIVGKLKLVDVLILPSLSEGFGLAALEALFAEKVVAASDLPAIREFITDKKNGLLFKPGDSEQLALILEKLITDFNFLRDMRVKIKKWLKTEGYKFDISNIKSRYERLFD